MNLLRSKSCECFYWLWMLGLISLSIIYPIVKSQHLACDNRKPEGHNPDKKQGDGGFRIIVVGPHANRGSYSPNEVYTVTIQGLKTRYSTQKFTEFLLVGESEKQAMMGPSGMVTTGIFHIIDDSQSRFSDQCPDGVTSLNRQPKSEISVLWTAPSVLVASCITFKATVVERPHMWYMDDGQLTKTICPESNKPRSGVSSNQIGHAGQLPEFRLASTAAPTSPPPLTLHPNGRSQKLRHLQNYYGLHSSSNGSEDSVVPRHENSIPPQPPPTEHYSTENHKCCACDEAKYEVIFEGIWSKDSHPKDFPENEWLLHFSDIIGASHSPDYFVWKSGVIASEGIRQVAEWGATRHLENEMKEHSRHINTIIKARGLWHPNEKGKTSAAFRVDRNHHLMSLVSMIGPSPDWIVGVSALELCLKNCTWLEDIQMDLFPFDAGTDSGITYMSPNTPTDPREGVSRLSGTSPNDTRSPFYDPHGINPMKPFAKINIRRQRIYPKNCNDTSRTSDSSHEVYLSENTEDSNRPECVVTDWTSWSSCSVTCGKGLRMRKRNYVLPDKADMFRCDRQLVEKEMCLGTTPTCPPDDPNFIEEIDNICAVSSWSDWSPCSVSCGTGTKVRHRRYKNHMGRKKCNTEMTETEMCKGVMSVCPRTETQFTTSDVDCPLSPWSEWAPCSVSCGIGYQIRNRFFLQPTEDEALPSKCNTIQLSQRAECTGEYGVECKLSILEAQQICSLAQESGPCRANKLRYTYSLEKEMCLPFSYGGCKGNRNRFESLAECNTVCGFMRSDGGRSFHSITPTFSTSLFISSPQPPTTTTEEFRTTVPPPPPPPPPLYSTIDSEENFNLDLGAVAHNKKPSESVEKTTFKSLSSGVSVGIKDWDEPLLPDEEENSLVIEPVEQSIPNKIDCVVSAWSDWSPCSVECGTGHRTRSREILVQPQNNGKGCPRKTKKKKICHMRAC